MPAANATIMADHEEDLIDVFFEEPKQYDWTNCKLPPFPGDRPHNPEAALDRLPVEVFRNILKYLTKADGDTLPYRTDKPDGARLLNPSFLVVHFRKLRLNRRLAASVIEAFSESLVLFRHLKEQDIRLAYRDWYGRQRSLDVESELDRYQTYTLRMTFDCIGKFCAVASNPKLAPLFKEIHYCAYDFMRGTFGRESFKQRLYKRFIRRDPAEEYDRHLHPYHHANKDTRRQLAKAYRECCLQLTEHQQILEGNTFEGMITPALLRLVNLETLRFTRDCQWGVVNRDKAAVHMPGRSTINPKDVRYEYVHALSEPVYWTGFFRLVSVMAQTSNITQLKLRGMVPDLSLVKQEVKDIANGFLAKLLHIDVEARPDAWIGVEETSRIPRYGSLTCRDGFVDGAGPEEAAWRQLLSSSPDLKTFQLSRGMPHMTNDFEMPKTTLTSVLIDLILDAAAPVCFDAFRLPDIDTNLQVFDTFIETCCQHASAGVLENINLCDDHYASYGQYYSDKKHAMLKLESLARLRTGIIRAHPDIYYVGPSPVEAQKCAIMTFGVDNIRLDRQTPADDSKLKWYETEWETAGGDATDTSDEEGG